MLLLTKLFGAQTMKSLEVYLFFLLFFGKAFAQLGQFKERVDSFSSVLIDKPPLQLQLENRMSKLNVKSFQFDDEEFKEDLKAAETRISNYLKVNLNRLTTLCDNFAQSSKIGIKPPKYTPKYVDGTTLIPGANPDLNLTFDPK